MTVSLASLMVAETKAAIYQKGLDIATALGLPVTSWQPGDPTRSTYHHVSEVLEALETRIVSFIAAGFLDYAGATEPAPTWLVLLAEQVYGYTAREATYATLTVTLGNAGGGEYPIEVGEITVQVSGSGVYYHNTSSGTLTSGPGTTLTLDFVADTAGSDGTAAAGTPGDIDVLVTSLPDVTVVSNTAGIGTDAESASSIVAGCRAKLGSLSPNGPADAYVYVATNADLTGATAVTKARVVADSSTGDVTVYVGGPSGTVSGGDVTLVQTAVETWATPLCITPTVASATGVTQAITYTKKLRASAGKTTAEIEADDETALTALFAAHPIGGDTGGILAHSLIESTLQAAHAEHCYDINVTTPAGNITLTSSQVAVLGAITPTITVDP